MGVAGATSVIIAALALLWMAIAGALSLLAARRFRLAQSVLDVARANARLLELTPARPLLVRADGRIEADSQLARDLGLSSNAQSLADLVGDGSGIDAEDLEGLLQDIETAKLSVGRIARKVRASGSGRVFEVRGGTAPPPERAGTQLLWFFDTSVGEEERSKLALRLRQTEAALGSLTHLIEAAPFPMWFRGPDLKLGLVNSAFVTAVEARDAQDVIERSAELIDAHGKDSAVATAREAQESGRIVSRMQPAIIHGERRMLRNRQRSAGNGRCRRICGGCAGSRRSARRTCTISRIAARACRQDDGWDCTVRAGQDAEFLQSAIRGNDSARA